MGKQKETLHVCHRRLWCFLPEAPDCQSTSLNTISMELAVSTQRERKTYMSNQIGDRYTCSDPNCGCEVKISRPCSMVPSSSDNSPSSSDNSMSAAGTSTGSDLPSETTRFRSEPTSTQGDFGA